MVAFIAESSILDLGELPAQIEARTFPTLLDLGIALAAGAAGGFVLVRRDVSAALPGVGIAVALVPPLAVVGILLRIDESERARGALLLYGTNLAAIVFAASLVFLASGFVPLRATGNAWKSVRVGVAITAVAVAGTAVPLGLHTLEVLEDSSFRKVVTSAVNEWDPTVRIVSLRADRASGGGSIDLVVAGPNELAPSWQLADVIAEEFDGPIDLTVAHTRETIDEVSVR
jgi:uncharacterized membrane protein